jgi:hypothetical protein
MRGAAIVSATATPPQLGLLGSQPRWGPAYKGISAPLVVGALAAALTRPAAFNRRPGRTSMGGKTAARGTPTVNKRLSPVISCEWDHAATQVRPGGER